MPRITNEQRNKARELFKQGLSQAEIGRRTGISPRELNRMGITKKAVTEQREQVVLSAVQHGKPVTEVTARTGINETAIQKQYTTIMRESKIAIEQPITGVAYQTAPAKTRFNTTTQHTERERKLDVTDAGMIDLWDYPNDYKKIGRRWKRPVNGGLFDEATLNIPYLVYQPAKRIHLVSHSLYRTNPTTGKLESNWVYLLNPDKPKVKVARHDIRTVNLSVGLPTTFKDHLICDIDACVLSAEAAKRLRFKELIPQTLYCDSSVVTEKVFPTIARDKFTTTGIEAYDESNTFKATGIFFVDSIKKMRDTGFKAIRGHILIERDVGIGDKLVGLTGLKVTVAEIRPKNELGGKDIIISVNQVWGEKASSQRGGMVKEIQESRGTIMVGLRRDELPEVQTSLTQGASLSPVLYPVLKIYAPKMLNEMIRDVSKVEQLYKTLHLRFNTKTGRFMLLSEEEITPETDERWLMCGHYLYDAEDAREQPNDTFKTVTVTIPEESEIAEQKRIAKELKERPNQTITKETVQKIAWDYVFMPNFFYESILTAKGAVTKEMINEMKGNTLHENQVLGHAKLPFSYAHRRTQTQIKEGIYNKSMIATAIHKQLFTPLRHGMYLRYEPKTDPNGKINEIELNNPNFGVKLKDGRRGCMIHREPVVGKNSVFCVVIKHNPTLPKTVIRADTRLITAMNGDADGDCLAVNPYYDEGLEPNEAELGKEYTYINHRKIKNIAELKPTKRTREQLIAEAVRYQNKKMVDGKRTELFGGLRNQAAFTNNSIAVQKQILGLAAKLEDIIKEERTTDFKKAASQMKALIKTIPTDTDLRVISKGKELEPKSSKEEAIKAGLYPKPVYERLLWFKPLLFWRSLFKVSSKRRGDEDDE